MMEVYSAKPVYDQDGALTGYEILCKVNPSTPVPPGHKKLYGDDTDHPMAELQGEKWVVVEDATKKADMDAEKSKRADARSRLESLDPASLTTVAKCRAAIQDILEVLDG